MEKSEIVKILQTKETDSRENHGVCDLREYLEGIAGKIEQILTETKDEAFDHATTSLYEHPARRKIQEMIQEELNDVFEGRSGCGREYQLMTMATGWSMAIIEALPQ